MSHIQTELATTGACPGAVRAAAWIALFVVATASLVSCAEDRNDALGTELPTGVAPAGGNAVNGLEREWAVAVDLDDVHAGPVTFTFKNVGTIVHEMLVVKTDLLVSRLPVDSDTDRFNEESESWEVIGEISEYQPGETKDLTVSLAPGSYQLVCNLPSHYGNGMATAFTVHG